MSEELAIIVEDLNVNYGKLKAVDGISFQVQAGTALALLGPNGAGKTTTIKALTTVLDPTSGTVRVGGLDVTRHPIAVRALIGLVPQETNLYEDVTVNDNLALHGFLYGLDAATRQRRSQELLELVGLSERANDLVRHLSGGMKRRLVYARGVMHDPQIVFLDEPTTGLDPQSRRAIWDYIAGLKQQGKTVVLTTHHMEEAEVLCELVLIVDQGRIIAQGSPVELRRNYVGDAYVELITPQAEALAPIIGQRRFELDNGKVRIYLDDLAQVPALVQALYQAGVQYSALSTRQTTLEDVFLKLTGRGLRE
ncbi:MAG: ATP-binding cassette domain-containing protein [Deinococcus sp.]|nr:ATP-binding cassette domain-containing protein [Deinococcus sp.]